MSSSRWPSVATVAERPIPLAWLEGRLAELRRGRLGRQMPPGDGDETLAVRRWIVQELVTDAVLVHEARQAGLLGATPARATDEGPVAGRSPRLPDDVLAQLVERVTRDVEVPEAAARAYFGRNQDLYRRPEARRIRYAIAESASRARAALAGPLAGGSPSRSRPGLGSSARGQMWLRRGELVGPLEDAVFAADVGATVGPFQLAQGWTAASIEAIRPQDGLTFEEARMSITVELLRSARAQAFEAWLAARRSALAVIEPAFEHPGHPVHGLPQHRH